MRHIEFSLENYTRALFALSILAISLSFDTQLPNGQSTRHPKTDQFIDSIRERLSHEIKIYEKKPLGKIILLN